LFFIKTLLNVFSRPYYRSRLWYATNCRPSVCRSVCNLYIVAKRGLSKFCLKKQIGLPDRYPYDSHSPNGGTDFALKYLHSELRKTASVCGLDSLWELTNALSNGTIADLLWTPVLPNCSPNRQNLHGKYLGALPEFVIWLVM